MDTILLVIGAALVIAVVYLAVKKKKAPKHQTGTAEGYLQPPDQIFGTKIPRANT